MGISAYCRQRGGRYLIGCSSVSSQDAMVGAAVYSDLCRKHLVEERFQTRPMPGFECPMDEMSKVKTKCRSF